MSPSVQRIHALLHRLAVRERGLLSGQAVFGAVAAATLVWGLVAAAFNLGWARPGAGWAWVAGVPLAALIAAAWPLRRWMEARDHRRQALRVEGARPALRGELLTVLDRSARPLGASSLIERLAGGVETTVRQVPPAVVLPADGVRRAALASLLGVAVLGLAAVLLPTGPVEALTRLVTPSQHAPAPPTATTDGPRALVGDITLRYLYPTYTGLEPLDVPNATGDVHAPPGTRVEVKARTAVVYPSALLEVYDLVPEVVPLVDGRDLSGAFTVAGPGMWRFRFGTLASPDYHIVPDPDLAPAVTVAVRDRSLAIPLDKAITFGWSATDDYGLSRVMLEIKGKGPPREVELRAPPDTPRRLDEQGSRLTPRELGLAEGDKVTLRVKAWDNDAVSGSKPGYSSSIQLEVLGSSDRRGRATAARRALRDAFVRVLAGFLVEPKPVVTDRARAAAWASEANARYEDADAIVAASFGNGEGSPADRLALGEVKRTREALLSFAHGFGSADGDLAPKDLQTERTLQEDHVTALEGAILLLDQTLRAQVRADLAGLAEEVATEAKQLQEDIAGLSRDEALARLDQLDRLLSQLLKQAAELGEGELQEFLNQRGEEMQSLVDEIRKALAEGREDDARELMERLARQLQELSEGMKDQQQRGSEKSDALSKAMDQLQQDLAALEKDQRTLREQTEKARQKHGGDMDQAVKAWAEIERLAGDVASRLGTARDDVASSDLPNPLKLDMGDRVADADGLLDSARARDLQTASDRAERLQDGLLTLDYGLGIAQRRIQDPSLRGQAATAQKAAKEQGAKVERIRQLLEQMRNRQDQGSPALQQELQQLASQQEQIQRRAEQAAKQAGQVAANLPMKAPGLERGTKRGAEQSGRATEAMKDGAPMEAEGGQQAAEDGFREAQDALDDARQAMQSMQPNQPQQNAGKDGKDGEGAQAVSEPQLGLPAPEEFQTPEAYREALLEGMSGAVPEEYKALNRRYYEELVRQ